MTTKELTDNITYLSALQMLERMKKQNLLSQAETERVETEMKRRLRPTLMAA